MQIKFASNQFNDKSIDINTLKGNYNDEEFEELKNLKRNTFNFNNGWD